MKQIHTLPALFALLVLSLSTLALATELKEPVGTVVAVRGLVSAVNETGSSRPLSLNDPLFRQDTVQTDKNGRAQLLFADNTIISLGRQSELKIAEYNWKPGSNASGMKTVVREGAFRVMGGAIAKDAPQNFTTETPSATIGIRGSMYAGRVTDGSLFVVFLGGRGIFLRNETGTLPITTPGFGSRVAEGGRPAVPTPATAEAMAELNEEFTAPADEPADEPLSGGESPNQPRDSPTAPADDAAPPNDPGTAQAEAAGEPPADQGPISTGADTTPAVTETVNDLVNQTIVNDNQNTLNDIVDDTTPSPPPAVASLTGRYLMALTDPLDLSGINNVSRPGSITAQSVDGLVIGTTTAGNMFDFSFSMPPYAPGKPYLTPNFSGGLSRSVDLLGSSRGFSTMEVVSTDSGDFSAFLTQDKFIASGVTYDFTEMGFAGIPADAIPSSIPLSGIDEYFGPLLSAGQKTAGGEFIAGEFGDLKMMVNWYNKKVMGVVSTSIAAAPPGGALPVRDVFFYGNLVGTGLQNVTIIGPGMGEVTCPSPPCIGSPTIDWVEGATTFAQFYGSSYQGIGVTGQGSTYNVYDQTQMDNFKIIGAAFRDSSSPPEPAKTGVSNWQGFSVGISENMDSPDSNRRLFWNTDPTDFQLSLNRNAGTLSGTLSAHDLNNPANVITNLQIGDSAGPNNSAVINDQMIIARLNCTTNDCIDTTGIAVGLKDYGNYLMAEVPDKQAIEYITWGYWEVAYQEPGTLAQYHLHVPSMWLAGEPTPVATIANISPTFSAIYEGMAKGVWIHNDNSLSELANGLSSLAIDFNPIATDPVNGTIQFFNDAAMTNELVKLELNGGTSSFNSAGFTAQIPNVYFNGGVTPIPNIATSTLNGTFYGPNHEAIGGNFAAKTLGSGDVFMGIVGGKRLP